VNAISSDEIAAMIREAVGLVFSRMLGLSLRSLEARREAGDPPAGDGVIALVGIAGEWTGSGRVYCSAEFACEIAGALVAANYREVNEEVLDGVAEIANMIVGNIKTRLEEKIGPLGLSVPTVIHGSNFRARTALAREWCVVPFQSGEHVMYVRFCLARSGSSRRSVMMRPETAMV
jgi:chemotaxis protein CheX